ncbi:hypothetical protein [Candidatus Absconditicoccus praedator]|uniref:hypothetical protein n=1 Tax=Candidatus Absconditicoccus praedator TaxID=2735562 RepID=UPI001E3C68AD|nr:hypothetical protein [Candidatus Absconditicoccus praedator]UFX83420.1 hypothetical protein HLG78_04805 [Candidatus Absconditicoccus praedator]
MKIGVIASGVDMLYIFRILQKFDFEYMIYWDWNNGYYSDKGFPYSFEKAKIGIDFLKNKGADKVILPPIYELYSLDDEVVLPLFRDYMLDVLTYSLVGKIGFLGDISDFEYFDEKFYDLTQNFQLTKNQKNISKFNFPFAIWKKQVVMWKYFLSNLSFRSWMINKLVKYDLRYFKDASVDTIIPLNYGYFAYTRNIKNRLNFNKIRFHGIDKLEKIFSNLVSDYQQNFYDINVYTNGIFDFVLEDKRWNMMLSRGKKVDIKIH